MPAQALQLMASKGYGYIYNGAWIFASDRQSARVDSTPWNFLPRFGVELPARRRFGARASPTRAS